MHTYLGRLGATDGKPRPGFGADGFRMLPQAYGFPSGMTIRHSRIYVAGDSSVINRSSAYVARLLLSGDPDPKFGRNRRFVANRYYLSAHGCGMTGEYPYLYHSMDFDESGYDGIVEPGMTICVESYIGEEGGAEGVKLEQQLLITESGNELISTFPFEAALLDPPV